jgi:hypothetical protein
MASMAGSRPVGYGFLRRLWLTRLSQPPRDRPIYRHALRKPPRRIIELGLGGLVRTERLLGLLRSVQAAEPVHYVGLDRFEGRLAEDPPGVTLKEAHRRLHALARVQLVPGNVDTALTRLCNHLGLFDLVLISADNDPRHLDRCWFFLQRIVARDATIFLESRSGAGAWATWSKDRIDQLATKVVLRRAA